MCIRSGCFENLFIIIIKLPNVAWISMMKRFNRGLPIETFSFKNPQSGLHTYITNVQIRQKLQMTLKLMSLVYYRNKLSHKYKRESWSIWTLCGRLSETQSSHISNKSGKLQGRVHTRSASIIDVHTYYNMYICLIRVHSDFIHKFYIHFCSASDPQLRP